MSSRARIIILSCDEYPPNQCHQQIVIRAEDNKWISPIDARMSAGKQGWSYWRKKDYCPAHKK